MSDVRIEKVRESDDRSLPVFAEMSRLVDRIRDRAFDLAAARGFVPDRALDDWLTAEREICWPAAELKENDEALELTVALAGFEPSDVTVTTTPRELIVKASSKVERRTPRDGDTPEAVCWSEFRSNEIMRRIELPRAIDVERTTATLRNGLLTVTAPKAKDAAKTTKPVAVAVAA
jgi:HSP20 family protein